jgi:hypothetical protein
MSDIDAHAANLASDYPSVRWQAQMEAHLSVVRESNTMLREPSHLPDYLAMVYAAQAQANATAALALAIATTGGDLEVAVTKLVLK